MSTQTIGSMVLEVDGQGDALVMLHGLGGTSNPGTLAWNLEPRNPTWHPAPRHPEPGF